MERKHGEEHEIQINYAECYVICSLFFLMCSTPMINLAGAGTDLHNMAVRCPQPSPD